MQADTPKISVIVPVYGIESYLPKCIQSLLSQTFRDIEIILVDDGSKDSSGRICDEFATRDSRIIVLHKPNGGLSSARNAGLDVASGSWIMHVDGDDWLEPDMLECLYNKAQETDSDVVFADFFYDYPDYSEPAHFYDWNNQGYTGLREYIASGMTCLSGTLVKKSLYDENNLRSPEGISCCEDFHLIIRLCYFAKKIAKIDKSFYHYCQRSTSILHNLDDKTEREERLVYSEIIKFFKERGVYDEFKESMAWRSLKASQDLALSKDLFDSFCQYNPDKKDYILNCPFIGLKIKIIAWLLTHRMRPVATAIIKAREISGR